MDKSELKKLLNLNKTSTKIRVVSGSYGKRLSIQFEEYKDSLIVNIRKLKIEGKQFIVPISWGGSREIDFKIQDGKTIEFGINPEIDIN